MTDYTPSDAALEAAAVSAETWRPSEHGECARNAYHRGQHPIIPWDWRKNAPPKMECG